MSEPKSTGLSFPSFPLEILSSAKSAATSTSNLILLLLLRSNRIVVPWLLSYLRFRHKKWITRVPIDVGHELRRDPNQRHLCAGPCCSESYGTFSAASPTQSIDAQTSTSAVRSATPSVQSWVRAVYKAYAPSIMSRETDDDLFDDPVEQTLHSTEGEIYLQLRIEQEKRHRSQKKQQFMLPHWLFRYFTLVSLVVYSTLITYIVVHMFEFETLEFVMFYFSLFFSGVVSEWDVLWPSDEGPPVWMKKHGDSNTNSVWNSV